jgi:hypothetical protein
MKADVDPKSSFGEMVRAKMGSALGEKTRKA